MLGHELVELLLGVLAAGVGIEHLVQVVQHLPDLLHRPRIRIGQGVAQAGELGVQHLRAQQVGDLLIGRSRLRRAPLVVGQLANRPRGVRRQRVQLGFGKPSGVGRIREQRGPFAFQRLVEQLPDLLQGAVQPGGVAQLPGSLPSSPAQRVQAGAAVHPAAQQPLQGGPRRHPGQHVLADLVQRPADVVRRLQRIRAAVPGPVPNRHVRLRRRCGRRPIPWPAGD